MVLIDRATLISELSPPLDTFLATVLIDEYISIERRFVLQDWEPAELDGGQFAEAAARILYHQDSGIVNATKSVDDCLKYVADDNAQHQIVPRTNALHLGRCIRTIWKFRSQRGAVHISQHYTANHMDSRLILENARWTVAEFLRLFWNGDRSLVSKAIREILQFDVPCIGQFDNIVLVQRTDLTPEEELLILLHYAGESGLTRSQLGKHALCDPPRVTEALTKLKSAGVRQVLKLENGYFRLTDLGSKRIRLELADKLFLE